MEDQEDPKRCAHLDGTIVIPVDAMLGKLKAALGARRDDDFLIIARTDAVESEGVEGAAKRARAYLDAGADMAFLAGPSTVEELQKFPKLVGQDRFMVVLTEGGKTPPPSRIPTLRDGLQPDRLLRTRHRFCRKGRTGQSPSP